MDLKRTPVDADGTAWKSLYTAWVVALAASAGAIFIGEVMGQAPCSLCWYQRAFMFPLAVILGIACFRSDAGVLRYALPLALAGGLVAGFHVLQFFELIPPSLEPCGQGPSCSGEGMMLFGTLSIPVLSAGAFAAIIAFLVSARSRRAGA